MKLKFKNKTKIKLNLLHFDLMISILRNGLEATPFIEYLFA